MRNRDIRVVVRFCGVRGAGGVVGGIRRGVRDGDVRIPGIRIAGVLIRCVLVPGVRDLRVDALLLGDLEIFGLEVGALLVGDLGIAGLRQIGLRDDGYGIRVDRVGIFFLGRQALETTLEMP